MNELKWYSTKEFWPGNEFIPKDGFVMQEFYIIYHHGDNELMTNLAFWNGKRFIVTPTCYCTECMCDCYYQSDYSDEIKITHWALLELPDFEMGIYFDPL